MGRHSRSRIEYAKTITWYDFCFNQLSHFNAIKTDYAFTKFIYKNINKNQDNNLFKKYKYGLSSPKNEWIDIVDSKIIGSAEILTHQIWSDLNNQPQDEELILIQLRKLPYYLTEALLDKDFYSMREFNKENLFKIAQFSSLDSLSVLYLLHRWGYTIGSHSLINDSNSIIIESLEQLIKKNHHLHRSHVLLFDELLEQIFAINTMGYNRPLKVKFNWRQYREKNWGEDIRRLSMEKENLLITHPQIIKFIHSPNQDFASFHKSLFG
ncbi:hypothetical protein ACX0AN_003585 [Acinetobacter baumannii]|uniref:hypothetical protein n=1 Tax=Acinetobacter TaxID=469 RepID=UPI0002BB7D5C|nr:MULTISPECIES: hypothetical protein [Acinetobacter]EHU3239227.1 hypothetical protein [Acinetobacter baumannii]EJB8459987.1 hypothetical protein [Acinetobacter baumannii]EJB8477754.1 hypothetical protein [Acinetobacter baumannii]EJB8552518.1 hypothetical protein [Acinetobacter baumannii]EJB8567315.1 hypothetical protein [Acinetobacter baumannii]